MTLAAPGTVVGGRYRLVEQLGQGGMGSVWKAEHLTLGSTLAIKLIDPDISAKDDMLERFKREAQGAASLKSPHVVQVIDYGAEDGLPFIAMELLDGETLSARLKRELRLSPADTARIVTHVARALARAHEAGIVHRDLKPENVFLVPGDEQEVAKVLDFGVAKHSKLDSGKGPTRTGLILGTPAYMSPEQAQGIRTLDGRSDLWSLGVIAFECLLGRVPFESQALGDLLIKICVQPVPVPSERGPVPPGFDAWFARACERDVDRRFQSAKELADALRAVLVPHSTAANFELSSVTSAVPAVTASSAFGTSAAPSLGSTSPTTPDNGSGFGWLRPSAPVSSGSAAPLPVVVAGPPPNPAGVTTPGMSVALQLPGGRPRTPLIVAVAIGASMIGGAGAFVTVNRLSGSAAARAAGSATGALTSSAPPAVVTAAPLPASGGGPAVTTGSALGVVETAVLPTAPPRSDPPLPRVAKGRPVASARPSPGPSASAGPFARPPPGPPSSAPPGPSARGAGDKRLGF